MGHGRMTLPKTREIRDGETKRGISIKFAIMGIFAAIFLITISIVVFYTYYTNSQSIVKISRELIDAALSRVMRKTVSYLEPAVNIAEISAKLSANGYFGNDLNEAVESYSVEILKLYPQISMCNIADTQGNFLMPKRMKDGTYTTKIIRRDTEEVLVTWRYRNDSGWIYREDTEVDDSYDPRTRHWYKGAVEKKGVFWTDVYIFYTDNSPGITCSYPIFSDDNTLHGVIGIDIELGSICNFLKSLDLSKDSVVFIFNSKNEVVAYPDVSKAIEIDQNVPRAAYIEELNNSAIKEACDLHKKSGMEKFSFYDKRKSYIAAFKNFPASFSKDWVIGVVVPEKDFTGFLIEANKLSFIFSAALLCLALLFILMLSRSISRPIIGIAQETARIKAFELDGSNRVNSKVYEIQMMSDAMYRLKQAMRAFRRYVPSNLVKRLIQREENVELGGKKCELTIFFSDIKGFTTLCEAMSPEEIASSLSEYLEELTSAVIMHGGTVDKYIGDAIMAFWGAPVEMADHALQACHAALVCRKKSEILSKRWLETRKYAFYTRIGINTGETIVGNIGAGDRLNYTVIGDSVNIAAKLEGINKIYGSSVLISDTTFEQVKHEFVCKLLDITELSGKNIPVKIYELIDTIEHCDETLKIVANKYEQAFQEYLKRDFKKAETMFWDIEMEYGDRASGVLRTRCAQFVKNPPPDDWNQVARHGLRAGD